MLKSKAIVWRTGDDNKIVRTLETINVDDPQSGEVLVKVVSCGICHTDVTYANYQFYGPTAMFGHEGVGIVEKVGEGITKVKPGDHVTMSLIPACGQCKPCLRGYPTHCVNYNVLTYMTHADGSSPYTDANGMPIAGGPGAAFSEYMVTKEGSIVKIPDDSPDFAGVFACGVQTGAGTVFHEMKAEFGDSIVVIGAGMVGLGAVMAAKIAGMSPIIVVASPRSPMKIEAAKKMGATHIIINTKETNIVDEVKKICPDGADFCIDTAGLPEDSIHVTHPKYGKAVSIGMTDLATTFTLPLMDINAGRTFSSATIGRSNPNEFVPQLIELYKQGKLPIDDCLKFYDLEHFEDAKRDFDDGKVIKAVIKM